MLRYFSQGSRNFKEWPDTSAKRTSWEFYAVLSGRAAPVIEDTAIAEPRSPSLWLVRPGISYHWESSSPTVQRVSFHFSAIPELLRRRLKGMSYLRRDLCQSDVEAVAALADQMMPYYVNPTEATELYAEKVLLELSLLFIKDADDSRIVPIQRRVLERCRRAEEWYQANMKRRPTIPHIAAETGTSPSQLRRDFLAAYGLVPHRVFRRLRLYEATRLLSNTDWTIDRIYPEAGFASKTDFHRTFKAEQHLTPHQWRKCISVIPDRRALPQNGRPETENEPPAERSELSGQLQAQMDEQQAQANEPQVQMNECFFPLPNANLREPER